MDRKSILILVASFGLLLLWGPLVQKLFPPRPAPVSTNMVAVATNRFSTTTNAPAWTAVPPATNLPSTMPPTAAMRVEGPEDLLVLETNRVRYTFTSHGGGIKRIELTDYEEVVECDRKKRRDEPRNFATLNGHAPVAALTLLGGEALQGDGQFQLSRTPRGVRAEKTLPGGLRLVKDFEPGSNYLVTAAVRLENTGPAPLTLPAQEWVAGTATPMNPRDSGQLMGFYFHDGARAVHETEGWFANRTLGCFPGTPRTLYQSPPTVTNVLWAAVHNQFFAIALVPPTNALPQQVVSRHVDLPGPTDTELAADPKLVRKPIGFQTSLVYPPTVLPSGQTWETVFTIYAGPKEYHTLAQIGAHLRNDLDLIMNFGGFWGFFAKALLLSMNGLHAWGLNYGVTIIAITVIIKLVFWPLTNASTKSMKRMSALQPQMKEIQAKFKDDPQKMNKKMAEFMKQHKVNPLGGCLPMLLQIPVFFGFYTMLQSAIELRGASFLWACDLSKSDTIFSIPGVNFPVNPMPLMMGVTMLWQARMTPPSPGMDPMQQKIMKYMPLMFIFILYNFSAGLTLYWTVQNLLSIAQMKVTRATDPAAGTASAPPKPGPKRPSHPKRE